MAKGSTEVLRICVPSVGLTLKVRADIDGKQVAYRARVSEDGEDVNVDYETNVECDFIFPREGNDEVFEGVKTVSALPVFFETRYLFRGSFTTPVNGKKIKDVVVQHRMASVVDSFYYEDGTLFGTLDFINEPGRFRLDIKVLFADSTETVVTFEFMVVSVKMNVKRDYEQIVRTIDAAKPGIVNAFLTKTYHGGSLTGDEATEKDWYEIFNSLFDYYESACKRIVLNPHRSYIREAETVRADRVKRWSPALVNRFARMETSQRAHTLFQTERISAVFDTPENRFVLYTLQVLSKRLEAFMAMFKENTQVATPWFDENKARVSRLRRLAYHPFFRGVGRFEGFKQQSLVMQKRAGYAQILTIWLKLKHALRPIGDDLDIGFRPISTLYEFWCFLKMQELLKGMLGVDPKTDWQTQEMGALFETKDLTDDYLGDAVLSKIDSLFEKEGVKYKLSYQKTYTLSEGEDATFAHLNPQRPDIVLSIEDEGKIYTYLFDAKYRVWTQPGRGQEGNDADASPRAAIDDMHRYRDAILYRSQKTQLNHEIIGAYVLYPGRKAPHLCKDYEQSIAKENIGAIPLLPTHDDELKNFLEKILHYRTKEEHLKHVITTRGTTPVLAETQEEFVIDKTLCCTYHGQKQLPWIMEKRLFNIPTTNCPCKVEELPQKKVIIAFSSQYGGKYPSQLSLKIRRYIGIVSKDELGKVYSYPNPSKDQYHLFEVEVVNP